MNKCEKILAERMIFRTGRGRGSVESQRDNWLRTMRAERKNESGTPWTIFCPFGWMNVRGTFRQAKFAAKQLENEHRGLRIWLVDNITKIQVWQNYEMREG